MEHDRSRLRFAVDQFHRLARRDTDWPILVARRYGASIERRLKKCRCDGSIATNRKPLIMARPERIQTRTLTWR
jgi:hypothetical protein